MQWILVHNYLLGVGATTTHILLHICYPKYLKALGYQFNCRTQVYSFYSQKVVEVYVNSRARRQSLWHIQRLWVELWRPTSLTPLATKFQQIQHKSNTWQLEATVNTFSGMKTHHYNLYNLKALPLWHSQNQMEFIKTSWHCVHNLRHLDSELHQNMCIHLF